MRSIERRYKNIEKRNPFWSSYICFSNTIKKQKFGKQIISKWFTKLVDTDDYDRECKLQLLRYLQELSNSTEDSINKGNI